MVDILIAMHAEYHTIRELELCVPTVNVAKRDELIRRIMIRRDFLVSRNLLQNVDTLIILKTLIQASMCESTLDKSVILIFK